MLFTLIIVGCQCDATVNIQVHRTRLHMPGPYVNLTAAPADKPKLTTDSHDVPAQHRTVNIQKDRPGPHRRLVVGGGGSGGKCIGARGPTRAWLAFEIARSETGSKSFLHVIV